MFIHTFVQKFQNSPKNASKYFFEKFLLRKMAEIQKFQSIENFENIKKVKSENGMGKERSTINVTGRASVVLPPDVVELICILKAQKGVVKIDILSEKFTFQKKLKNVKKVQKSKKIKCTVHNKSSGLKKSSQLIKERSKLKLGVFSNLNFFLIMNFFFNFERFIYLSIVNFIFELFFLS